MYASTDEYKEKGVIPLKPGTWSATAIAWKVSWLSGLVSSSGKGSWWSRWEFPNSSVPVRKPERVSAHLIALVLTPGFQILDLMVPALTSIFDNSFEPCLGPFRSYSPLSSYLHAPIPSVKIPINLQKLGPFSFSKGTLDTPLPEHLWVCEWYQLRTGQYPSTVLSFLLDVCLQDHTRLRSCVFMRVGELPASSMPSSWLPAPSPKSHGFKEDSSPHLCPEPAILPKGDSGSCHWSFPSLFDFEAFLIYYHLSCETREEENKCHRFAKLQLEDE